MYNLTYPVNEFGELRVVPTPDEDASLENLIVNYGGVVRKLTEVKQVSHSPPKKPLPMYQLASPVTEWGAPGAFTRRLLLVPDDVPGSRRTKDSGGRGNGTTYSSYM